MTTKFQSSLVSPTTSAVFCNKQLLGTQQLSELWLLETPNGVRLGLRRLGILFFAGKSKVNITRIESADPRPLSKMQILLS